MDHKKPMTGKAEIILYCKTAPQVASQYIQLEHSLPPGSSRLVNSREVKPRELDPKTSNLLQVND